MRSDVNYVKSMCGEKSTEYTMAEILNKAQEKILNENVLTLKKECKKEDITIIYFYSKENKNVYRKEKMYINEEKIKIKEFNIDLDIDNFINYTLYNDIINGYKIV